MAISKVSQYNSTPTEVADYAAQNAHIQGFINQANGLKSILYQSTSTVVPTIAEGAYIAMGGTLYLADAEYTILGTCSTSSDNYIYLTVSGDELTATWTQSISGYSWNSIYNYYSNGTNALLQYKVRYSSSSYLVNLYSPLFQDLSKTGSPTFAGETVNGNITVTGNVDGVNVSSEASTNSSHRSNTSNPHSVTKEQITGLKSTDSPTFSDVTSSFHFPNISTGSYELCRKTGEEKTNTTHATYFTFTALCSGTVSVIASIASTYSSDTAYVIIGGTTYSTSSTDYVTKSGTISVTEGDSYSVVFYSSSSSTTPYSAKCNSVIVKGSRNNTIEKVIWNTLSK